MSDSSETPHDQSLIGDVRWQLSWRVANSAHFRKSPRLRQLLLHLCERRLQGRLEDLHERQIGCEVFARRLDFNCDEDNIVRVEMRNLRRRLEEYFSQDGAAELVVISIPKGNYVPCFASRPEPLAAANRENRPGERNEHAPEAVQHLQTGTGNRTDYLIWLFATVIGLAIAAGFLFLGQSRLRGQADFATERSLGRLPLLSEMFDNHHQTLVVAADACLSELQDLLGRTISLREYLSSDYPTSLVLSGEHSSTTSLARLVAQRQYTSLADMNAVTRILAVSHSCTNRISIRYARFMRIHDFKTANAILLGSRHSNPWVELFEPRLNFIFGKYRRYNPDSQ